MFFSYIVYIVFLVWCHETLWHLY